jgi:hypothetical protein
MQTVKLFHEQWLRGTAPDWNLARSLNTELRGQQDVYSREYRCRKTGRVHPSHVPDRQRNRTGCGRLSRPVSAPAKPRERSCSGSRSDRPQATCRRVSRQLWPGRRALLGRRFAWAECTNKALAALRGVDGSEPTPAAEASIAPATRKGRMTREGRKRLSAALRKRWALKKKAAEVAAVSAHTAAPRKVRLTPEGRRRLSAVMKRRWAVKRAASV